MADFMGRETERHTLENLYDKNSASLGVKRQAKDKIIILFDEIRKWKYHS